MNWPRQGQELTSGSEASGDENNFHDVDSSFDNSVVERRVGEGPAPSSSPASRAARLLIPDPDPDQTLVTASARAQHQREVDQLADQVAVSWQAGGQDEPETAAMVDYDSENGTDTAGALQAACVNLKGYEFSALDLKFYFNQVEIRMQANGVKKQWTKFQVLSTILPVHVVEEVKKIMSKRESEFPENNSYLKLKTEILRIFAPSEESNFERAMNRVLTGKPSTLCKQIINDLCDHDLDGCCCTKTVFGMWRRCLPTSVKQALIHKKFNKDTLDAVLQLADDAMESANPSSVTVAAMQHHQQATAVAAAQASALDQGFYQGWVDPYQPASQGPEVAAIGYRGRGRGGGGYRSRGQGQRGRGQRGRGAAAPATGARAPFSANNPRHRCARHPDLPPWEACRKHFEFGKSAFHCVEPLTCPWKNFIAPNPRTNLN